MKVLDKVLINNRFLICEYKSVFPNDFGPPTTMYTYEIFDLKKKTKMKVNRRYKKSKHLQTRVDYTGIEDMTKVKVLHLEDKITRKFEIEFHKRFECEKLFIIYYDNKISIVMP